jgi:altronate dehydratase
VVSLGCETIQGPELLPKINQELAKLLVIQESGGATGTFESGVKDAKQLRENYQSQKVAVDKLTIGLDISRSISNTADIKAALTKAGFEVVIQEKAAASEHNMAKLMGQKAHLILSVPDENQPPSGFPLIPVINIASQSALHQALISEFDLANTASNQELLELINKVANGQKSKAESSGIGEIVAPRAVRSV